MNSKDKVLFVVAEVNDEQKPTDKPPIAPPPTTDKLRIGTPPPAPPIAGGLHDKTQLPQQLMQEADDGILYDDDGEELEGEGKVTLQIDDEEPIEFEFSLPEVPGSDMPVEVEPAEIVLEDKDEVEVEDDPWKWNVATFMDWLKGRMRGIPPHDGKSTAGIERAIAYLEALNKEISRAVRQDLDNKLAIDALEKARDEIHKGIDRLNERLEKIRKTKYPKRASENATIGFIKEATRTAGITVVVPLFISSMARTCINSMVSAGKDIEDCFEILVKKYKLTEREQAELMQLLSDSGYSLRRPRGHLLDEKIDTTSSDNLDWAANYPA